VEGYTDCIMAHQYGLTNFVATLGTALNESHVTHLKRLAQRVVLVFDGDSAGKLATEKALPKFLAQEIDLRILTLPGGLDPADFLIERGPEALVPLLDSSIEAWEQKFRLTIDRYGLDSIDNRHRVLSDMLDIIRQVPIDAGVGLASSWQMRENVILGRLSQVLKIGEETIRERLLALRTAHQQKSGVAPAVPIASHDAQSPQSNSRSFPRNPTRDELAERELLELIFTWPEQTARIRGEIRPADVTNPHLMELLELCFQLLDQGVLPGYERVTARLEDAGLKNLAAEIDLHARALGITADVVDHTLGYFRRRRELAEKSSAELAGPHDAASQAFDQSARDRLRQATELHRKRVSRTILK